MEDPPPETKESPYDWASDPESGVSSHNEIGHQPIGVWRSGEGTSRETDTPVLEILEHGVHEGKEFLKVLLDMPDGPLESTIPVEQFMEGNPAELVTTEREEPPAGVTTPPAPAEETPAQPEPQIEPPTPRRIEVTHEAEEDEEPIPLSGILASLGEATAKAEAQRTALENELASLVEQINQATGQKDFRRVGHLAEQAQDYKARLRRKEKSVGKLKRREALARDLLDQGRINELAQGISEAVSSERTRRIRLQDREPLDNYQDMITRLYVGDYVSKGGIGDPRLYESLQTEITGLVKTVDNRRRAYIVQDNRVVKEDDLRAIDQELAEERQKREAWGWAPVQEKDEEATLQPHQIVQVVYDGKIEPYWQIRSLVRNSSGNIMAEVYPPYRSEGRAPFWVLESQLLEWQTRQAEQPEAVHAEEGETGATETSAEPAEPATAEPAEAVGAPGAGTEDGAELPSPGPAEGAAPTGDRSLLRPLPDDMPGLISRGEPAHHHRSVRSWLHLGGHRSPDRDIQESPAETPAEALALQRGDKLIQRDSGELFTVKSIHHPAFGSSRARWAVTLGSQTGEKNITLDYDELMSKLAAEDGPWIRAAT